MRPGSPDEIAVVPSSQALWIDEARFENPDLHQALGRLGWAILPVRLERGKGAVEVLGVGRASAILTVTPAFEPASERLTRRLNGDVSLRRGALAAICRSKNLSLRSLPQLTAVQDLHLRISVGGEELGERSAAYYREGSMWLISLQSADRYEAIAAALAEPFGVNAADLKYRFAKILRARRSEIAAILAEDGIPGYRIRDALFEYDENDEEDEESAHADAGTGGVGSDAVGEIDDQDEDRAEDDSEGDDAADQEEEAADDPKGGDGAGGNRSSAHTENRQGDQGSGGGRRRLTRRKLFGGAGESDRRGSRRAAGEAAGAAAQRGLQAEAWLLGQIATHISPGWEPMANVRDEHARETDVLLSQGGEEWHIEVKSLTGERLYWSELEREKAELHPSRYIMALLTNSGDGGFSVRWSWDPLADLAGMHRRVDWLWEGSSEGPSIRHGWTLEPGIRWPERRANRYVHAVRITQEALDGLDHDGPGLPLLRARIGDD